jgi:hypothetical protein
MTVIEIKRSGNQLCTEPREIRILDSSGNAERSIRSTKRIENCEREAIASIPRFVLRAATAKMMSGSDCAQVLPDKKFRSRSHDAVIRVYDEAGNVVEMQQHAGEFKGGAFTFVPENGAPKVTTALPPMRDRRYFSNPDGFNFLKPITL